MCAKCQAHNRCWINGSYGVKVSHLSAGWCPSSAPWYLRPYTFWQLLISLSSLSAFASVSSWSGIYFTTTCRSFTFLHGFLGGLLFCFLGRLHAQCRVWTRNSEINTWAKNKVGHLTDRTTQGPLPSWLKAVLRVCLLPPRGSLRPFQSVKIIFIIMLRYWLSFSLTLMVQKHWWVKMKESQKSLCILSPPTFRKKKKIHIRMFWRKQKLLIVFNLDLWVHLIFCVIRWEICRKHFCCLLIFSDCTAGKYSCKWIMSWVTTFFTEQHFYLKE